MIDENSVDFVKKFQDLTKLVAGENNKTPTSSSSGPMFPVLSSTEANSRSSDDSNSGSLNFKHILQQTNMNGSWLLLLRCLYFCPSTCFSSSLRIQALPVGEHSWRRTRVLAWLNYLHSILWAHFCPFLVTIPLQRAAWDTSTFLYQFQCSICATSPNNGCKETLLHPNQCNKTMCGGGPTRFAVDWCPVCQTWILQLSSENF